MILFAMSLPLSTPFELALTVLGSFKIESFTFISLASVPLKKPPMLNAPAKFVPLSSMATLKPDFALIWNKPSPVFAS